MVIVAIDSSTKKTGISVWVDGKLHEWFLLDHESEKDSNKRMKLMCVDICENLNAIKPNSVYIENTTYQANAKAYRTLTIILGVVYGWCINNKSDYYCVEPSAWRKPLGFSQGRNVKRAELKRQSLDYIEKKYGITDVTDDVADCICIGDAVMRGCHCDLY